MLLCDKSGVGVLISEAGPFATSRSHVGIFKLTSACSQNRKTVVHHQAGDDYCLSPLILEYQRSCCGT